MILFNKKVVERYGIKEVLVILCDKKIIGKALDRETGFSADPDFYAGEILEKEQIIEELKKATIINALGNESVELLIEEGYTTKNSIKIIGNTPHAQVILFRNVF